MIPKLVAHVILSLLLLFNWHYWLAVVNIPLGIWLFYEYYSVPDGNTGVYDPTEIHNRGQLKKHMRDTMIFLGYYFTFFFIYLYCLIISLLKGNPLEKADTDIGEF